MVTFDCQRLLVAIKGGGEMASGIALRLYRAGFRRLLLLERDEPLAVRRTVCFCEAVHDGTALVEGVEAVRLEGLEQLAAVWAAGKVAVLVDPTWQSLAQVRPHVLVDALLAKKNLGTTLTEAPLVIGIGPGFTAPVDVHRVVESNRGHDLGRVLANGRAQANTGIPGETGGYTIERLLRAPASGLFTGHRQIGELVTAGLLVGDVGGTPVLAAISGTLRGLIRSGTRVRAGVKIGDIDPRGVVAHCWTVSDKSRAIGGAVLEAILEAMVIHSAPARLAADLGGNDTGDVAQ